MAYTTATIKQIDPPDLEQGRIHVIVSFSGPGVPDIDQGYWLDGSQTAAQLQAQVAAKATALNEVVTVRQAIALNEVISITPPTPTPPTQQQTDIATFQKDWVTLQRINAAVSAGLLSASDPAVTSFLNQVKTEWNTVVTDLGGEAAAFPLL